MYQNARNASNKVVERNVANALSLTTDVHDNNGD